MNPPLGQGFGESQASAEDRIAVSGFVADSSGLTSPASKLIRADGRVAEVVRFEETVVSFFLDAAEILGVPKSVAAIYAVCFASPEPLSFADINSRLEISQGSISQGLRVLKEVGALKVVREPGNGNGAARDVRSGRELRRREFFTPDLELRKLVTRWIEQRLERQLQAGKGRLQAMKESIPAQSDDAVGVLRSRLHYLESWHNRSRALVPVMKTFLKLP